MAAKPISPVPCPPPPTAPKLPLCRLFSDTCKTSEITMQRLSDQSKAAVCRGNATYPPILGFFGPIHVPYPKGLNCWFNPL